MALIISLEKEFFCSTNEMSLDENENDLKNGRFSDYI